MKSSPSSIPKPQQKAAEHSKEQGRIIAQGIEAEKAQMQKNMIKAEKRHHTMLQKAAEQALSGGVQLRRPQQIT